MIREWMTFPSVIIHTVSYFPSWMHAHLHPSFKTHIAKGPSRRHLGINTRKRFYLSLTPLKHSRAERQRCSLIDWPFFLY